MNEGLRRYQDDTSSEHEEEQDHRPAPPYPESTEASTTALGTALEEPEQRVAPLNLG